MNYNWKEVLEKLKNGRSTCDDEARPGVFTLQLLRNLKSATAGLTSLYVGPTAYRLLKSLANNEDIFFSGGSLTVFGVAIFELADFDAIKTHYFDVLKVKPRLHKNIAGTIHRDRNICIGQSNHGFMLGTY